MHHEYLGTIHILRKHLQGDGGSENANFCLFSVLKTCIRTYLGGEGGGVQKNLKMCLHNI